MRRYAGVSEGKGGDGKVDTKLIERDIDITLGRKVAVYLGSHFPISGISINAKKTDGHYRQETPKNY